MKDQDLLSRQLQGVLSDQQRHWPFGASLRGSGSVLTDGDRVGVGRDLAQVLLSALSGILKYL